MKKSVKRSLDAYIRQMDRIDLRVIACVILLNVFGLIMIYSASAYSCSTLAGDICAGRHCCDVIITVF